MIGIQTVQFVLEGMPQTMGNQRGYELEYEVPLGNGPNDKNLSCIPGPAGGGTDLMLRWLDETVIPATLAKLGMSRGEVSISGGSVAGLTSCYAASARPDLFRVQPASRHPTASTTAQITSAGSRKRLRLTLPRLECVRKQSFSTKAPRSTARSR